MIMENSVGTPVTGVTIRDVQFGFRVLPLTQLLIDVLPRIKLISLCSNKASQLRHLLGRTSVPRLSLLCYCYSIPRCGWHRLQYRSGTAICGSHTIGRNAPRAVK